ncbi:MAG: hypothetical protein P4L69_14760, partial [Desulfosporosinus sp.]|nr:hypothetical protein [Desulfosporosinus sp.]
KTPKPQNPKTPKPQYCAKIASFQNGVKQDTILGNCINAIIQTMKGYLSGLSSGALGSIHTIGDVFFVIDKKVTIVTPSDFSFRYERTEYDVSKSVIEPFLHLLSKEGRSYNDMHFYLKLQHYVNTRLLEMVLMEIHHKDVVINDDDIEGFIELATSLNLSEPCIKLLKRRIDKLKPENVRETTKYAYSLPDSISKDLRTACISLLIKLLTPGNVIDTMKFAWKYSEMLKSECASLLIKGLAFENVYDYIELARECSCDELKNTCISFLIRNLKPENLEKAMGIAQKYGYEELKCICTQFPLKKESDAMQVAIAANSKATALLESRMSAIEKKMDMILELLKQRKEDPKMVAPEEPKPAAPNAGANNDKKK